MDVAGIGVLVSPPATRMDRVWRSQMPFLGGPFGEAITIQLACAFEPATLAPRLPVFAVAR